MKHFIFISALFSLMVSISCKKSNSVDGLASVNIINANTNVSALDVYQTLLDSAFYLYQGPISYESSLEFGIPTSGSRGEALTLVNSSDTSNPLFQGNLHLVAGAIYSFYVTGQYPSVDTLFLEDYITNYSDSLAGVRFINLSTGSNPMSVNLVGNNPMSQIEFSGLAYKTISAFKTYPDTNGVTNYTFELHDSKTGNLIYTYTWNFTLFKNNTLVICGSEDSSSNTPISIFSVNNF